MKAKPRWMKRVIKTAKSDQTVLPFHRSAKGSMAAMPLKKTANA